MFVAELVSTLERVQPSPLFFPEFPFIVNRLNGVKQTSAGAFWTFDF